MKVIIYLFINCFYNWQLFGMAVMFLYFIYYLSWWWLLTYYLLLSLLSPIVSGAFLLACIFQTIMCMCNFSCYIVSATYHTYSLYLSSYLDTSDVNIGTRSYKLLCEYVFAILPFHLLISIPLLLTLCDLVLLMPMLAFIYASFNVSMYYMI